MPSSKTTGKKSVNLWIDVSSIGMLKVISSFENRSMSDIVNELTKGYIVKNEPHIREYMKNFWSGTKEKK